jgi:hypothetical protein
MSERIPVINHTVERLTMIPPNVIPLYPEIAPQHIRDTAYRSCHKWLEGELWQEELPKRDPPQRGSEAVRVLGATLGPMQRIAFIEGWDRARREWAARRALYLTPPAAPVPSRRFKALVWGASLAACLGFWWAVAFWFF